MIALNSEAIMETEERLGVVLKKLIKFHELLATAKDDVSLE
jgi:hypothetical protein